jgi:two-component system, chemotaxis family, protein-glutamate methylesterase/glutaminase
VTTYELIVVGASWGGLDALGRLLDVVPDELDQPFVVAQHRSADSLRHGLAGLLKRHTRRLVKDADDKDALEPNVVYLAPPDYHLLVEPGSLHLSTEAPVEYARPSIDVLFETAADAYRERLIGIVLTGANADGAAGLARIKALGGVAIVQDPSTSIRRAMPDAAIAKAAADAILPIEEMGKFLYGLCCDTSRVRTPS